MRKTLFNAATKYVSEHCRELGLDPTRLAVAGESVGGYTTAVVAQLAKQRKGPAIRYQVLMCPVTDSRMSQPTYEEFANGPWLTDSRNGVVLGCLRSQQGGPKEDDSIALVGNARTVEGLASRSGYRG